MVRLQLLHIVCAQNSSGQERIQKKEKGFTDDVVYRVCARNAEVDQRQGVRVKRAARDAPKEKPRGKAPKR